MATVYELPPPDAGWCDKRKAGRSPGCDCGLWHNETVFLAALRPPANFKMDLVQTHVAAVKGKVKGGGRKRATKPTNGVATRYAAPEQAWQKALETVVHDRQLLARPFLAVTAAAVPALARDQHIRIATPALFVGGSDELDSDLVEDPPTPADETGTNKEEDASAGALELESPDDAEMGAPSDAAEADAPADPEAAAAAPLAVASVVGSGSGAPTAKDPPVDDTSLVLALPPFTPMDTPLTRQELRVVRDALDTTQRQYGHVIIDCKSSDIQINGKEMRRMRHGEWLWDVHIDLYMHLLNSNAKARKSKHCYCFNSSLMNQLTGDDSGKYSYGLVRRRTDLMKLDCFHGEDLFIYV